MDPVYLETLFKNFGPGGLDLPPPAEFPSAREVRKEAQDRSRKLLSSWRTLGKILDRHEELLRKRWMKKTTEQRSRILLAASPNLPHPHRPDFVAFRGETTEDRVLGTKFRNQYLRPYMNLEDLGKARSLLLFLNARGRHPPHAFAHSDLAAVHLGLTSGATTPAFLNGYTMLLNGQSVETYGKLIAWDAEGGAFEMMMSGRGFHPGEGLLVLEIQQEILRVLVHVCQTLLQDMDPNSLTGKDIPIQPEPPSLVGDPNGWPTLAAIRAESPYRTPSDLNIDHLRAIIFAQRRKLEDHIWALRTDPGYFVATVKQRSDHRQEILKDTNKEIHPRLYLPVFWDRVMGSVVTESYGKLFIWDQICRQVDEVARLRRKYANTISPAAALPREYMKAILGLRGLLLETSDLQTEYLKTSVPASPPLRGLFVRVPPTPDSTRIGVRAKRNWTGDWLITVFYILWDARQTHLFGLPNIMDFFEHIVDNRQKPRMSEHIYRICSDLGVLAEALHQINLYQPWASGLAHEQSKFGKSIEEEVEKKIKYYKLVSKIFGDAPISRLSEPGPFPEEQFDYPVTQLTTEETIDQMHRAEKNLDDFWQVVESHFQKENNGSSIQKAVDGMFAKPRPFERIPESVDGAASWSKEAQSAVPKEPFLPLETMRSAASQQSSGATVDPTGDVEMSDDALAASSSQTRVAVGKRAFKVFSTLFPSSSPAGQPGEIPWSDFLHAMAAMGFEPMKLYGSLWQFTPRNKDVERSIQFHEPYLKNKISYSLAREFGRRLQRAYGWSKGLFMLAQQ